MLEQQEAFVTVPVQSLAKMHQLQFANLEPE